MYNNIHSEGILLVSRGVRDTHTPTLSGPDLGKKRGKKAIVIEEQLNSF